MEGKEILYLIEKLESKTISPQELKRLKALFNTSDVKVLLQLMHEKFDEVSNSAKELSGFKNEQYIRSRLIKQITQDSRTAKKQVSLYYWASAAIAAILVIGFIFLYDSPEKTTIQDLDLEWAIVNTSPGEHKKVTLSDGTSILLNGNTTLAYPKQVLENVRLVKLKGEAFFEVAKNKKRPFFIISKDFTTQVVGTSFNIDSDIGKAIEVNTGTVHVFALDENKTIEWVNNNQTSLLANIERDSFAKVILTSGEKANLNSDNTWATSAYHYKNWMDNELVYFNEPLSRVVQKVYRNYGDSITLDAKLASENITITFKNKQKEQVLTTLAELCNGKLRRNNTTGNWEIIQ